MSDENKNEKKGKWTRFRWYLIAIFVVITGFTVNETMKKIAIIYDKNNTIISLTTERDSVAAEYAGFKDSLRTEKIRKDSTKKVRKEYLLKMKLADIDFGILNFEFISNPNLDLFKKEIEWNFSNYWYALPSISNIVRTGLESRVLLDVFNKYPKLFLDLYNKNRETILWIKENYKLGPFLKGAIPYLSSKDMPYEKEFEKFFLVHSNDEDYGSLEVHPKWNVFSDKCIKDYPSFFDDSYQVLDEYRYWRGIKTNLDPKSKEILFYILSDYNQIEEKKEKSKKKKKKKEGGVSILDLIK